MASKQDSTGGTTPATGEAVQAVAGVGGVRSSDDPVPDLWFGQPTEERRGATCSAARRSNEGLVTAPWAISANSCSQVANPCWHRGFGSGARNSESRMRENRLSGLMRGGKQIVIGLRASQSIASRLLYTFESEILALLPDVTSTAPGELSFRRHPELGWRSSSLWDPVSEPWADSVIAFRHRKC
jgi:hypothetical protein